MAKTTSVVVLKERGLVISGSKKSRDLTFLS